MAVSNSGGFDYFLGGRPLATLEKDTGNQDYWLGGRPLAALAPSAAAGWGMLLSNKRNQLVGV